MPALIPTMGDPDAPTFLGSTRQYLTFGFISPIPSHEEPDNAGVTIRHHGRIAASVPRIGPDNLNGPPRSPVIGRTPKLDFDGTMVIRALAAPFTKRQE